MLRVPACKDLGCLQCTLVLHLLDALAMVVMQCGRDVARLFLGGRRTGSTLWETHHSVLIPKGAL
eukprot:352919-Chlamydomonas_euryale.AAC.2